VRLKFFSNEAHNFQARNLFRCEYIHAPPLFRFQKHIKIKDRRGFIQGKNDLIAAKNDYRRRYLKANDKTIEI